MKRDIVFFFAAVLFTAAVFTVAGCSKAAAPLPPPVDAPIAAEPVVSREPATVENIQRKLVEHGAKLKVDGKMGAKTKTALKKFQKENGLKVTGAVDSDTLDKLNLAG